MQIHWVWLAVGLIPYSIKRHQTEEEQALINVRAFFWQFTVHWQQRQCSWEVYIPLIEHLRRE